MQKDTTHFKALLLTELDAITEELKTLGVHNPENKHDWIATPIDTDTAEADENTSADHAEDLEERTAILADLEKRYNETLLALEKIENNTYGICEISGEPIEEDRLLANPSARTCTLHREAGSQLPS